MRIYFYPHKYLRDRQIDTIKYWYQCDEVVNIDLANRVGGQVNKEESIYKKKFNWRKVLPLINMKKRPSNVSNDVAIYVWGGVMSAGPYIVELDNPLALTGYNVKAIKYYKEIIKYLLLQDRCLEIRCISNACRRALGELISPAVMDKAVVKYPYIALKSKSIKVGNPIKFLFVSTQFEIKGGSALINAFVKLIEKYKNVELLIVTHLPEEYLPITKECRSIKVHSAKYSRQEIGDLFLSNVDVLIHPTYLDSFGMVVLEALSYGLPIIANNVYAINEMVIDSVNGYLLEPPISKWDGVRPSKYFYSKKDFKEYVKEVDTKDYESRLCDAMSKMLDKKVLTKFRKASLEVLEKKFL